MKTERITEEIALAAELLRSGGLVAVPTETVYGLAGNGLDETAVEKIYEVKGRPGVKPLSLMVPGSEAIGRYCENVPPQAYLLAEQFWPGPLTLVLKARDCVPALVRAGGETVGLRCPDHPLTLALLKEAGVPFAAPSANPSGEPSPKTAGEVLAYFDGQIEAVCDGGPCGLGVESTLLSLASTPYRVLRRGALSEEELADALVGGMKILGLTGGSGAGKTTALAVLKELGALVLDADDIYHGLLQSDGALLSALSARFPAAFLSGGLDRRALAEVVFKNPAELASLNRLSHRFVALEIRKRLREHAMQGGLLAAIDAVELISSGLGELCDCCYAVTAPREQRLARIMRRDGLSRAQAEQRLDAQRPDDYYIKYCDGLLQNDSDEESFRRSCRQSFLEELSHG